MAVPEIAISKETLRRFVLGKQGLYPGRRWRGAEGAAQALRADCVVQVDPLASIARSPDIALYGRVLDYTADQLDALLYTERACFEYGNMLRIYPIEELPYFGPVMRRKLEWPRWKTFSAEHAGVVEMVRREVAARGPLGPRDLDGKAYASYRGSKDSGVALFYLWMLGELLIHSRRRTERVYDLRERLAPPGLERTVSEAESDDYLALKSFRQLNLPTRTEWRGWFSSLNERTVGQPEASRRLSELLEAGRILPVRAEGEAQPRYLPAEDLPLLEQVAAGRMPAEWQPLETTTAEEMVFLAPLEVASARGRALPLFGFDYVWEVYKPAEQRRWGYYTLPILHGDRLAARFDSKIERAENTLLVRGFWLEDWVEVGDLFLAALAKGFERFLRFTGAERLAFPEALLPGLNAHLGNPTGGGAGV